MFASIISGALISLAAVLSGAAAADGGGARMGTDRGHDRRHCRRYPVSARSSACPTASPSPSPSPCPPGGSAISRCSVARYRTHAPARQATVQRRPRPTMEWYPVGRILLWIAGFAALTTIAAMLTLGTDADDHHRHAAPRPAADSRAARRGIARRYRALGRGAVPSSRRPAAAIVAMMTLTLNLWLAAQDHGDIGPAAPALAGSQEHRTAADDAGGAVASRSRSASSAGLPRCSRRSSPRR